MIKSYFEETYPKLQILGFSLLKGGSIDLDKNVDYYMLLVPVYIEVNFFYFRKFQFDNIAHKI